ncbi:MAG TPA: DUF2442 domain-containing protein [Chitinophagales bacterium]|nr:DUF2442 domain-containing protein [Chitinophagales bacterium]
MEARIEEAKVLDGYNVEIKFIDGTKGQKNFSDLVGKGVFADWANYENFRKVHVTHHGRVLEWEGERDFCADSLYLAITGKTFAEYAVD